MQPSRRVEALEPIRAPGIAMWLIDRGRASACSPPGRERTAAGSPISSRASALSSRSSADNPLSAGRYYVGCTVVRGIGRARILLHKDRATDFVSYGAELAGLDRGRLHRELVSRKRAQETGPDEHDTPQLEARRGAAGPPRSAEAGGGSATSRG